MKFLKQFENWNPVINKDVEEFIQRNKTHLMHLWDKDMSEEENIEFLTNYFREFPELMNDTVNLKDMTIPKTKFGLKNSAPILQNIGSTKDFRSF